ncbi:hypothetical protein BV898_16450 [Hypsibius exemplaris]|uniref:G-protein coupled receptors family 1 profile domain-containing protein n=1 Tax=Hypsibius exemplaris TaxID=2072580 RepID=A0A9X6RLA0_HYPEX|nr:hypothetical protein BV898_16450 [Hypsibius exemplaris]
MQKHQVKFLATKRFGQVTKRFGQVTKRFGQVTKRFGQVTKRFDQATERFGQVTKRFDQATERFDQATKQFALLDLIIGSAYFPLTSPKHGTTHNHPQSPAISVKPPYQFLLSAKYYSVLFLAVNRFFALTLPRAYRTWSSPRRSYLFVLTAWLIGTSVYVPSNLLRLGGTWASAPPWGSCGFRGDGSGIYEPFAFAMTYIPTVLAIAIYGVLVVRDVFVRMGRFLGRGQSDIIPVGALTTSMQRNRRWTRILVVMTFCEHSVFCAVLFLAKSFRKWVIAWPPLGLWIRTVGLCSFWVNPVSTLSSA